MSEKKEVEVEIAGCISSEARSLIKDALYKRAASLDPQGVKAKKIMDIIDQLDELDSCEILLSDDGEEPSKVTDN